MSYTILIVDDDAVFRAQMKSIMNWEEEGFTIIAEARNGKEAIESIEKVKPDIVITDMSMPVMNGVELIEYLSEYHQEVQVIALSAYNDFNFVRDSMKKGAVDYLLKDQFDESQCRFILKSVSQKLSQRTDAAQRTKKSRERLEQEFILLLLSGCAGNQEEISSRLRELNLENIQDGVIVAVAELDNQTYKKALDQNEYYRFMYSIKSILQESSHLCRGTHVVMIGHSRMLMLIPVSGFSFQNFQNLCRRMLTEMQHNVKLFLNENISFGVSGLCKDISELPIYYEQVGELLEKEHFHGKKAFIAEVTNELQNRKIAFLDMKIEQNIYDALNHRTNENVVSIIGKLFDDFIRDGYNKEDIQMVLAELLNIATKVMQDNQLPTMQVFSVQNLSNDILLSFNTLPQIKEWYMSVFEKLDTLLQQRKVIERYNENTRRAIDYMNKNYSAKISLKDIARELHVNRSYLSRLFKSDTGVNIIDYLNTVRLEKAADLIRKGSIPLNCIANSVGIQSYNHFFKLFKDHYGITPGEYKQKIQGNT